MSEDKKNPATKSKPKGDSKKSPQPPPSNVVNLFSDQCSAEGCKKKSERAGFCAEHYVWFKEGLITIQGKKAKDFDRKLEAFMEKQKHNKAA